MINLNILLDNIKSDISSKLPTHLNQKIEESIEDLKRNRVGESTLKLGDTLPNFALPNLQEEMIESKYLLKDSNYLIVSFYRGTWCPYCNMELNIFQKVLPQLKQKKANLVAISPQCSKSSKLTFAQNPFDFDILVDYNNKYAKSIGIAFELQKFMQPYYLELGINLPEQNGTDDYSLPIPATFVIDKKQTIVYSHVDADYSKRVDIDNLLNSL